METQNLGSHKIPLNDLINLVSTLDKFWIGKYNEKEKDTLSWRVKEDDFGLLVGFLDHLRVSLNIPFKPYDPLESIKSSELRATIHSNPTLSRSVLPQKNNEFSKRSMDELRYRLLEKLWNTECRGPEVGQSGVAFDRRILLIRMP